MTKFAHFREYTEKSSQPTTTGGCTAAYTKEGNTIVFAVALCSPKDHFCRAKGRLVAEGRLNKGKKVQRVEVQQGQSDYDAILGAML